MRSRRAMDITATSTGIRGSTAISASRPTGSDIQPARRWGARAHLSKENSMSKFEAGLLVSSFLVAFAATPALAQDSTTTKPAAPVSVDASTNVGVTAVD